MLLLDGDEDDITYVRMHWVMKGKRLMVLTRKEVDANIITDSRMDDGDKEGTADRNEFCVRTGVRVCSVSRLVYRFRLYEPIFGGWGCKEAD